MLDIKLSYGKKGLNVKIPKRNLYSILKINNTKVIVNPEQEIIKKLKKPIGTKCFNELCKNKKTCCIVVSDKTRAVPNEILLNPILDILDKNKIRTIILIACGMHSPTEGKDLISILGKRIIKKYKIINHNGQNKNNLVFLFDANKNIPVYINRAYAESDFKIITGLVEPHFMAGFSGGRKSICPGIVGIETMKYFHSPEMLESPFSKVGVLKNNPLNIFASKVAIKAGVDFMINVTLNQKKEITNVFCGDLDKAYEEEVKACEKQSSVFIDRPVDIVITSNGGYPLDRDFYQTVKGIVSALDIIKNGGTIIIASACLDGLGSPAFRKLLFGMRDINNFMKMISTAGFFNVDQWEVEELIKALRKVKKVKVYSDGLTNQEIKKSWCEPVKDINKSILETIKEYGNDSKVAVIPDGPYILAKLNKKIYN
ncbi:MAG: nickel-dependent lactate racemase [Elusimicrobia bacterium]|nr:nickel-dependent lactate racemase [Elusimicrobiota bacterium]